jgi:hypothetical protein
MSDFLFLKKIFTENKKKFFSKVYKILADLIYSYRKEFKIEDQFMVFDQREMNSNKLNFKILILILIFLFRSFLRRFKLIN